MTRSDTLPGAPDEVDGRRLRREHNREAVLDALVALFREGIYQPSSNEIADRAGISPRSLFRYFDDIDDLSRAAIERQLAAARPIVEFAMPQGAGTGGKIDRLVDARVGLFETTGPAARAARVCAHRNVVVARQLREARAYLRHQVEQVFAAELTGERVALLPALDALCSFETYELLRGDQGMSRPAIVSALRRALSALLSPTGGSR
ncbi:MAG: TetR/AcrR family transcriptional regulator [Acidimicrobiales bacterium]